MKKRPLSFILLILFIGCILATGLSILVGFVIPEGVVKDFFTLKQSLDEGFQRGYETSNKVTKKKLVYRKMYLL